MKIEFSSFTLSFVSLGLAAASFQSGLGWFGVAFTLAWLVLLMKSIPLSK